MGINKEVIRYKRKCTTTCNICIVLTSTSAATTTVWLDADPAETGPSTPSCPTGHFTIPFNQTSNVAACVIDSLYSSTWECLDFARLGISVFDTSSTPPFSVVFDDYSVRPQLFKYGPQPPDFNGSTFTMNPYLDKEDDELGVALFFSVLFDKLVISKLVDGYGKIQVLT